MQRRIQNGGKSYAEYSGCLRRCVSCRYGCNDHAWYEELRNNQKRSMPAAHCAAGVLRQFCAASSSSREKERLGRVARGVDARTEKIMQPVRLRDQSPSFCSARRRLTADSRRHASLLVCADQSASSAMTRWLFVYFAPGVRRSTCSRMRRRGSVVMPV